MIEFILLFFPAIFSILVDEKINGKEDIKRNLIIKYTMYTFLILLSCLLTIYLFKNNVFYWTEGIITISFITKYLILSCGYAIILPIICNFILANFEFKIILKKDDKK